MKALLLYLVVATLLSSASLTKAETTTSINPIKKTHNNNNNNPINRRQLQTWDQQFNQNNNNGYYNNNNIVNNNTPIAGQINNNYGQGSCAPGMCWHPKRLQCFHLTSFECNAAIAVSTPSPTPPPIVPNVNSIHPIQLIIENVGSDYVLSPEVRSTILRFVSERLEEYLTEVDLDLIKVEYAGQLKQQQKRMLRHHQQKRQLQQEELKSISIPLKITVRGPADIQDFSLSYVMEIIRTKILSNLLTYLRDNSNSDGATALKNDNVIITADTFNFDNIIVGNLQITNAPTPSPTPKVEIQMVGEFTNTEETASSSASVAWWVWLLVALVIITCLLGTCCYCTRRNRDDKNELHGGGGQQQINLFLQNKMHHPSKDGQSVAMSHRSRQQQHPRISNGDDAFLGQPIAVKRSTRDDDVSRLTSRTKRSHKTSSSSRKKQHQRSGPPRRELELATIPQEDPPEESVVNGEGVVVGRDPTMYQEEGYKSSHSQLDPEGDKLSKKKSMFASGALMNEVHREREQNQSSSSTRRRGDNMNRRKSMDKLVSSFRWAKKQEPMEYNEGAIVAVPEPPEEYDTDYAANNTNNKKQKSSSTSKNNRRGNNMNRRKSMDKLVSSFRWTKKQDPIDIDMDELEDCPQIDLEVGSCDSPSILTNHNPGDGDLPSDRNPYQRDANTNEDYSGYERSNEKKKKNKSAKKKTKKDSGGGGNRRASRQNRTAGAFRSFRKSISWGDGGGDAADDDSYDRD